ncbi:MAG: hypothetical protein ACRCYZ_00945 [Alphaproteobacteria bacterium]
MQTNEAIAFNRNGQPIENEDLKKLIPTLQHTLQFIDFGNTKIGDEGIQALAEKLPSLPNLQHVNLVGIHLGPKGILALRSNLPLTTVEKLDVDTEFHEQLKNLWNVRGKEIQLEPKYLDNFSD